MAQKTFHFIIIKPSHYDDDGYVLQWGWSSLPSNSIATLYGLGLDCAERNVLGPDTRIELHVFDESNTRIDVEKISRLAQGPHDSALVALAGVQSNQFPRAVDIGRRFRKCGLPVCIGGFHVSGSIAMLPGVQPELQEAMDLGISLFAGELEGRCDVLLRDAYDGTMKPLYNYMQDLPDLKGAPVPFVPASLLKKKAGLRASLDTGRGCPFECSFCTVINVQGRKSRSRSADDVERFIRANLKQGVANFFLSDDDLARNKNWEPILDRIIHLRENEGLAIRFVIQADMVCHKVPGFIEKAARAGVTRVFLGMESINAEALQGVGKRQNNLAEYRKMLEQWHAVGALTYAGYILGFPTDSPESILDDIRTIQREVPVDLLEFFILTPLPGSRDHADLVEQGVAIDPDLNKYDACHVTTAHPLMTKEEWTAVYNQAWDAYYSPEHVEAIIRRAGKWGYSTKDMMVKLLSFHFPPKVEKIHPLDGGIFRLKYRKDRRPGMPIENPFVFYPRYVWECVTKVLGYVRFRRHYSRILRRALKN